MPAAPINRGKTLPAVSSECQYVTPLTNRHPLRNLKSRNKARMSMKTKEDVKNSRGQEVEESRGVKQEPAETPQPQSGLRRAASQLLDFPTLRHRYRRNKARMSMKTKEEVKKSRGQEVEESRGAKQEPTGAPTAVGVAVDRLLDSSTSRLFDTVIGGTKRECL